MLWIRVNAGGQRWVHYQRSFVVAVGSVDIALSRGLNPKIIVVCGTISLEVRWNWTSEVLESFAGGICGAPPFSSRWTAGILSIRSQLSHSISWMVSWQIRIHHLIEQFIYVLCSILARLCSIFLPLPREWRKWLEWSESPRGAESISGLSITSQQTKETRWNISAAFTHTEIAQNWRNWARKGSRGSAIDCICGWVCAQAALHQAYQDWHLSCIAIVNVTVRPF